MKKYSTPDITLMLCDIKDIITASDIKTMSWEDFLNNESGLDM